ncbi:malonic semialdehyde reductase [Cellulomonas sp. 73-145]|uniref:malonic semialdehyde reductase n=1 Tax=Cellulomonas sp. 73-145 TaxID=1895739 RepID=UPI000B22C641|nr:malonic semialdehyde reductase [Cellulomonas sp. 73-145]MBN9327421.1 malonic semialdehyde reductase [Cellulomonas sp.]
MSTDTTPLDTSDLDAELDSAGLLDGATADLLFRAARTAGAFTADEVTDAQLQAAYDLAKWGPTAMNVTPLRMLVVRTPEARARLAAHMNEGNRQRVLDAPVTLLLAADTRFHQHLPLLAPHRAEMVDTFEAMPQMREQMARNNAWLQAGYLVVALRAAGLATAPMGGMDATAIDDDLLAGTGWASLFVVNVGQAEGAQYPFPRAARLDWDQATRTV